jgi:hypothetical protein
MVANLAQSCARSDHGRDVLSRHGRFFIVLLPLIFWCLHKSLGIRLSAVLIFSLYLNLVFKDLFAAPRPYQVDPKLYALFKAPDYGLRTSDHQSNNED